MTTVIEYTGRETKHHDRKSKYDFTLIDPDGRRLSTELEELTVSDQGCTGEHFEATVSLPDPKSEAALLLMRALMKAMELDYELVAKQPTA
jgi:hypothetical protein